MEQSIWKRVEAAASVIAGVYARLTPGVEKRDLQQEAVLAILEALDALDPDHEHADAWLKKVARHAVRAAVIGALPVHVPRGRSWKHSGGLVRREGLTFTGDDGDEQERFDVALRRQRQSAEEELLAREWNQRAREALDRALPTPTDRQLAVVEHLGTGDWNVRETATRNGMADAELTYNVGHVKRRLRQSRELRRLMDELRGADDDDD